MTRIPRALHVLACLIVDGMSLMGGHSQLSEVCDQFCANASVPAVFGHKYLELKCVVLWLCLSATLSNVGCPKFWQMNLYVS